MDYSWKSGGVESTAAPGVLGWLWEDRDHGVANEIHERRADHRILMTICEVKICIFFIKPSLFSGQMGLKHDCTILNFTRRAKKQKKF
jgi:hypothetical protein